MFLSSRPPARALMAPLLAGLCSGACATLLDPRPPLLRIRTDTVVASVRDADGRLLGTTPFEARLRARRHRTLVIAAPGYDSTVLEVGWRVKPDLPTLLNPLSWPVDAATGAWWIHAPDSVDIILSPSRPTRVAEAAVDSGGTVSGAAPGASGGPVLVVPPPGVSLPAGTVTVDGPAPEGERVSGTGEALSDAAAAVVLAEFADAAEAAGCEPLLVGAWRDAARALAAADPSAVPDSVRREAAAELDRVATELSDLCTRPSPRVDRLREIRERLSAAPDTTGADSSFLLAPVFFGPGEWEVRDDSTRARLRALAARLVDAPVTLVVVGYTDAGELPRRELGVQRALSVIRELRAAGLAAGCCVVAVRDPSPPWAHGAADARLNRRVVFTLDYREEP